MVCVVTGSSRGLGRAIALAFGKKGNKVVIHYKEKKNEAESVAALINESMAKPANVSEVMDVKRLVREVINRWGRIDVLVNNAGITREALLVKTSEELFDDVINTNLKGSFNFIQSVGPFMMKQQSGHIINISSYAGMKGKEGLSAYAAAKAGLIGLTKTAAQELSEYNVMVNAVLPGFMMTEMGSASSDAAKEKALKDSLVTSFSNPDRVAEFICHMTETQGVTGQVFNLDSRIL